MFRVQQRVEARFQLLRELRVGQDDRDAVVQRQAREILDDRVERLERLVGVLAVPIGVVAADVEQERLERRSRRIVVALGEQLGLAAELELHRAGHDALAAAHDFGELGFSHRRIRNLAPVRLRQIREDETPRAGAETLLDAGAKGRVAIHVVSFIDHDQVKREILGRELGHDPPFGNLDRARPLERLVKKRQATQRAKRSEPLLEPLDHGEAERGVSRDVQAPLILLEHLDEVVQRDERLSRARRRADVKVLVLTHELELLGLVRGRLVQLENDLLVRARKLAAVRRDLGAQLVPEVAVEVT